MADPVITLTFGSTAELEDYILRSGLLLQINSKVDQLLALASRQATKLTVGNPVWINKVTGVEAMAGPYSVTNDHDLQLDLVWADDIGPVAPRPGGTTAVIDDVSIVSAVDIAANDASCICRVTGTDGTANVTLTNDASSPPVSHTFQVVVGDPVATSLDTANPVAVPHGTAAG